MTHATELNAPSSAKSERGSNPFQRARRQANRLKLFIYGDTGMGKTSLALNFPSPAVIDLEAGSTPYAEKYEFDVLPAATIEDVERALEYLRTERHGYRTLVIDPITVVWEMIQKRWSDRFLARKKGGAGHKSEFYEFQPGDWQTIKADLKALMRRLLSLDLNIIATARQKPLYSQGEMMKVVGDTFDGEKNLPYFFDAYGRIERDGTHFKVRLQKDRGEVVGKQVIEGNSPGELYRGFADAVGEDLSREAEPVELVSDEHAREIRRLAGLAGIEDAALDARIAERFGVDNVESLAKEDADAVRIKLRAAQ